MSENFLQLTAVTLPYGNYHYDLRVEKGSFVVVLGPSGAGKSSLLHAIGGFVLPTTGQIYIDQQEVTHLPPHDRQATMLFQGNNLFQHLTVWDNVALGVDPRLSLQPQQEEQLREMLTKLHVQSLTQQCASKLSGGEAQRVALARCLVQKKPLLLLDEPFAGLDPPLRRECYELVYTTTRQQNITTLMVSHFPQEVRPYADELIFLDHGRVIYQGKGETAYHSKLPALRRFLG